MSSVVFFPPDPLFNIQFSLKTTKPVPSKGRTLQHFLAEVEGAVVPACAVGAQPVPVRLETGRRTSRSLVSAWIQSDAFLA